MSPGTGELDLESFVTLVDRAGDRVTEMKRAIVSEESESDLIELAEDLWDVLDELEDVLSTIDFEEVPEAIKFEELPEVVDVEEIPEGLVSEDETAIDLGDVRQAVRLRELWDAVDLTSLVREKRELDSAVDDVQDHFDEADETEEENGGLLDGDVVGNDDEDLIQTDLLGGDDEEEGDGDDDGLVGGLIGDDEDDLIETDLLDDDGEDGDLFENVVGTEGAYVQFDAEARQAYLEELIQDAVREFRSMLLWTHDKLRRLYEANQRKLGQPGRQPDSLNPTARSTLPPGPVPDSASTRASTVPEAVKYSKVDNPRRIYGRRFSKAIEGRNQQGEDGSDTGESDESEADTRIERRESESETTPESDR